MLQEKKLSSCCIHVAALPKLHYTTLRDLCSLCLCVNIWMVSCFWNYSRLNLAKVNIFKSTVFTFSCQFLFSDIMFCLCFAPLSVIVCIELDIHLSGWETTSTAVRQAKTTKWKLKEGGKNPFGRDILHDWLSECTWSWPRSNQQTYLVTDTKGTVCKGQVSFR